MLHPTKNDLPEAAREKLAILLNRELAHAIDMGLQAKQAHWNVRGPGFIALHELFDKVSAAMQEGIDILAERCTQLGGTAHGTIQSLTKYSVLKPYPTDIVMGQDHVKALSTALAEYGRGLRQSINTAGELGDADTVDIFTELSRNTDKYLWFVEVHLEGAKA
jgi:starvation-inducible DNA-binding protein